MLGLFCGAHANSEEKYTSYQHRRIVYFSILILAGVALFVIGFLFRDNWKEMEHSMEFYYYGGGTGLIFGGVMNIVKITKLLRDPEEFQRSYTECNDERKRDIAHRAVNIAVIAMMAVIYLYIFIGGISNPEIVKPLAYIVIIFTFAYTSAYRILEKRM